MAGAYICWSKIRASRSGCCVWLSTGAAGTLVSGQADLVTLQEARDKAIEGRRFARAGADPAVQWRRATRPVPTFEAVARQYHETNKSGWKNAKHAAQWLSTLETYAFPTLSRLLPNEVDAPLIWTVLGPIWQSKPETARRLRQRIGTVLDYAKAHGWRETDAPMRALAQIVSKQSRKKGHFAAMPYQQLPDFMAKLRHDEASVGRLALMFTILTAGRSGEVRGATWDEIDFNNNQWNLPGERMKAGKPQCPSLKFSSSDPSSSSRNSR